jgi:hypothetical protein
MIQKIIPIFSLFLLNFTIVNAQNVSVKWENNTAILSWAETLADPAASGSEVPFSILTGPYVGWLTDTSATIGWEVIPLKTLDRNSSGHYSLPSTTSPADCRFYSVELGNLNPDTEYQYRITSSNGTYTYTGDVLKFRTYPSQTASSFRFAVTGDTRNGDRPRSELLIRMIHEWNPRMFMVNGDIVSDNFVCTGTDVRCKKGWYRLFDVMRELRSHTFLAPTLGNHDAKTGLPVKLLAEDYFRDIPKGTNAAGPAHPPFYYSFDVANIHFVALCTELGPNDGTVYSGFNYNQMMNWVEEDLKNTTKPWKIAFWHHPSGAGRFFPLLQQYGVQLSIFASCHLYERSLRVKYPSAGKPYQDDNGIVKLISGGGGQKLAVSSAICCSCDDMNIHVLVHHYTQVEVFENEIHVTAIDTDGAVVDAWKLPRVGQPEPLLTTEQHPGMGSSSTISMSLAPNPFNPLTVLNYYMPSTQKVRIDVVDTAGRVVKTISGFKQAGTRTEILDFSNLASGIYTVRLKSAKGTCFKQALYLK